MGKTLLLTGTTGFLGSYLLDAALRKGYQVIILKRTSSDTWRIKDLLSRVKVLDLDKVGMESAFQDVKIDIVINTACCYGRAGESSHEVLEVNLMFPLRLLELAVKYNVSVFVNTGTLLPREINDYSLSKLQFVEWLKKYSGNIQCVNFKPEHMYGLNDDNTKFVYWLLGKMICSEEKIDLTKGDQMRDFIHVTDVVAAYMMILDNLDSLPQFAEFDVCSGELVSVKDFVLTLQKLVKEVTGVDIKNRLHFGAISYRQDEVMEPKLSNAELKSLGWKPEMTLSNGLRQLVGGFK